MEDKMAKAKWKLVNSENVAPFGGGDYQSRMLTGNEMAGQEVININEGTLKAGGTTNNESGRGGVHELTEIYYIIEGDGDIVLDGVHIPAKAGDVYVIPGGTCHWIDNSKSTKPFRILTFWERQEQNEVYHTRLKAWGTSVKNIDDAYTEKRMKGKK
jgi:mannose-6-phosphate isomerase-like protein (cupin superfamily)